MIKYHGTPITPISIFEKVAPNRNLLVSWANPQDIERAVKTCDKLILDNGAFTFWSKKQKVNWDEYYEWVTYYYEFIEYFFIPDVIDGSEEENDRLIEEYFKFDKLIQDVFSEVEYLKKGIPVWHVHESFDRLRWLMKKFDYIAFGSSGDYSKLGTEKWHRRMNDAMKVVCDKDGFPYVKIHMLRCLNPKIFTMYPFYSGDSTNVARNHNRKPWNLILDSIEKYNSPENYVFRTYFNGKQLSLF